MPLPYSEKILEHFRHPHNVGKIDNPDAKATEGSPACGDMVSLSLKIDEKEKRITDIRFESYGCASNIATGSIITDMAKGKTLQEAKKITWKMASEKLGGLPPIKVHCAVLAVDALKSTIDNYEQEHGLIKEKVKTTEDIVSKRLRHVINPMVGLDVVKTNIVRNIKVDKGKVTITVDIPKDNQFAGNIKDEIVERTKPLWDVEEVKIEFID